MSRNGNGCREVRKARPVTHETVTKAVLVLLWNAGSSTFALSVAVRVINLQLARNDLIREWLSLMALDELGKGGMIIPRVGISCNLSLLI